MAIFYGVVLFILNFKVSRAKDVFNLEKYIFNY